MKTLVIYCSQTGFTARYAQWIAQALGADLVSLAEAKRTDTAPYDAIVFGSWFRAGSINKLGWFKGRLAQWRDKKLVVFCVGASPMDSPDIAPALRQIFDGPSWAGVHAFYCPGGLSYERMSLPSRLMMRLFAKAVNRKKDKTPAEEEMARVIAASYDISDRKYIEPILKCLER